MLNIIKNIKERLEKRKAKKLIDWIVEDMRKERECWK